MAASHGGILYYVVPVPREDIRCEQRLPASGSTAPPAPRPLQTTDSGWDNPFRPDGDLSREADEIVELIKGGKPITPTPGSTAPQLPEPVAINAGDGKAGAASADGPQSPQQQQQLQAASPQLAAKQASPLQQQVANSKPAAGANGNAPGAAANATPDSKPAAVEVQRGTVVQPSDASQVEHVVIKKKPKCKCCVIQ